jgi:transposase-like protein
MNTFRHDEEQRRQWVQDKLQKRKSVKQIIREAQISRATLYNWIDEFEAESIPNNQQATAVQDSKGEKEQDGEAKRFLSEKKLPIHHTATRHRMLLAALEKVDADKGIARKLAATLVKRFTLSIAQACEITGIDEATYGYKPRKPEVDDRLVQQSIVQLLSEDPSKSFDQCYVDLKKQHPDWTRKQIKRVYREGRLYLQRRRSRKGEQEVIFPAYPQRPGAIWNLGILKTNTGLLLFILDDADTVLLNTETVNGKLTQELLNAFLNRAIEENGKPRRVRVPDKQPFQVREITRWALAQKLSMLSLGMGKEENQLEVQGMEESAMEQMKETKATVN